jgi:hypothetical protein
LRGVRLVLWVSLARLRLMLLALRVAARLGTAGRPVLRLGWVPTPRLPGTAARRRGAPV